MADLSNEKYYNSEDYIFYKDSLTIYIKDIDEYVVLSKEQFDTFIRHIWAEEYNTKIIKKNECSYNEISKISGEEYINILSDGYDFTEGIITEDLIDKLHDMDLLQKDILNNIYNKSPSVTEIAQKYNKSQSTISYYRNKIIESLRKLYTEDYDKE